HQRLDVLINNAGRSHNSLLEETTPDDARSIFEINFWGMVRMNAAVLPLMHRQGEGLIFAISSIAGIVGTPGQGFYSASKHAIEGYTETLRTELAKTPIQVFLIEPGYFQTEIWNAMIRNETPMPPYDDVREQVMAKLDEGFETGGDPSEVAATIEKVIDRRSVRFRHLVGKDAKTIARLKRLSPQVWFLKGAKKFWGIR
ncbi:MAG: SDR family NAD(P)-dependent oxidoreductase, partial [Verrucomicrobiota bacterium]